MIFMRQPLIPTAREGFQSGNLALFKGDEEQGIFG
jgi:hypothetical protein